MTCDMWHLTHYMWLLTCGGRWTFSQNVMVLALTVWEGRCIKDICTNHQWVSKSMNQWRGYTGTVKYYVRADFKKVFPVLELTRSLWRFRVPFENWFRLSGGSGFGAHGFMSLNQVLGYLDRPNHNTDLLVNVSPPLASASSSNMRCTTAKVAFLHR